MIHMLKSSIFDKVANVAYVIMLISVIVTFCFVLIGKEGIVEVLGIVAFVSLTIGVLFELMLTFQSKKL